MYVYNFTTYSNTVCNKRKRLMSKSVAATTGQAKKIQGQKWEKANGQSKTFGLSN